MGGVILQLVDGWESQGMRLTPTECVLLAALEGGSSWETLRQLKIMPPAEVDSCIQRWMEQGLVRVEADDAE